MHSVNAKPNNKLEYDNIFNIGKPRHIVFICKKIKTEWIFIFFSKCRLFIVQWPAMEVERVVYLGVRSLVIDDILAWHTWLKLAVCLKKKK